MDIDQMAKLGVLMEHLQRVLEGTQRVVTYSRPYSRFGPIELCREHASSGQLDQVLGPVEHGDHVGQCESCLAYIQRVSP